MKHFIKKKKKKNSFSFGTRKLIKVLCTMIEKPQIEPSIQRYLYYIRSVLL